MKKILLCCLLLSCFIPVKAEATVNKRVSCKAEIPLQDGTKFNYRISGVLELADDGRLVSSPTASNSNLFVTIVRRDRNGKETLIRKREELGNMEHDRPDADYSVFPFSANFKGKPNNGRGLYNVRSAQHGIYMSLIPRNYAPKQIQVVHYLSSSKFVRSKAFPCS